MSRKQVVLPDPEGPSMAKNSPSAMSRVQASTARTEPKRRVTLVNRTAGAMEFQAIVEAARIGRPGPLFCVALLAEDGNVVFGPLRVGHALALLLAFGRRRAPEPNLVEIVVAVGGAAGISQKLIALAGRWHRWHRAEPGGEIALQFRIQGMLEPLIGTVGILRVDMHHRGVGPPCCPFRRDSRGDRLLLRTEEIDLERPGRGSDHALVLEVVDLDHGIVPIAA